MTKEIQTEIVVLGGGPGGYSAAFRAADLGKEAVLIEWHNNLGGVCLHVGCIPSKTLLHIARVINEVREVRDYGVDFSGHEIDLTKVQKWRDKIIAKLVLGLN